MSGQTCPAQAAGYDGMFGVYCERPKGHEGLHCDGWIEWRLVSADGPGREPTHECGRLRDAGEQPVRC